MRLLLSLSLIIFFATVAFADLYYWQDKDGNAHIADKIEKVPEEYRETVRTQKSSEPTVEDKRPQHQETVAGKKARANEELYGDQPLSWWTKKFKELRREIDRLEREIVSKKKAVERYRKDQAVGKAVYTYEANLYERHAKEIPEDESARLSLLDELDRLLKTAREEGVPRAARGE